MKTIDRMALAGFAIGVLIATGAYLNVLRTERTVAELVMRCEELSAIQQRQPAVPHEPWLNDPLVCEPLDILPIDNQVTTKVHIQRQIFLAQSAVYDPATPYRLAAAIVILGCIPWTWYFLLRRLREVVAALTGK